VDSTFNRSIALGYSRHSERSELAFIQNRSTHSMGSLGDKLVAERIKSIKRNRYDITMGLCDALTFH
jgi:hypothetical protein